MRRRSLVTTDARQSCSLVRRSSPITAITPAVYTRSKGRTVTRTDRLGVSSSLVSLSSRVLFVHRFTIGQNWRRQSVTRHRKMNLVPLVPPVAGLIASRKVAFSKVNPGQITMKG
jgi:hypothetical protein